MDFVRHFEQQQIKDAAPPALQAGDVVRVTTKLQEGDKTRLQAYEGTVIGIRGSGPSATFTVRRDAVGFGVERIFPLYSPLISAIEVLRRQRVRRAKLTYLRQAGQRRFKEDVAAMQRYIHTEQEKKRLAEEARKRTEEEKIRTEKEAEKKEQASSDHEQSVESSSEKSTSTS